MKTKETLYTTMCNNIGQVRIENAQKEIERLNRQYNTNSWRTDGSPFMFVEDETDDDVHNPCELIEGYVWVTCEPKVQSTIELAADWFTSKSYLEQHSLSDKYFESRNPSLLTIEQVEEIWKNEVQIPILRNAKHNVEYLEKPNQKQFKQFDESLFKAYIDKFSDEDKLKARNIIESTIPSDLLIEDALKRLEE